MSDTHAPAPTVFVAGPASWNLIVHLTELPRPEPHMQRALGHHWTLGGTSAGKAMNLSRLGAQVTMRTIVGDDEIGRRVRSRLTAEGATVIAEMSADPTEQHVNLMAADGSRVSLYLELPGLANPLHQAQTTEALVAADAVVIDLAEASRPLLREAHTLGRPVWVDLHDYPGPGTTADEFFTDFIECADYVFLSSDRLSDPRPIMTDRIAAGARIVVCTHGSRGATALTRDGHWHQVQAVPVAEVVDTNGAGDAFFSAFLMSTLAGHGVPTAMSSAASHAALAVQSYELAPERAES